MLKAILFDLDDTLLDWGDFYGEWERVETPHVNRVYQMLQDRRLVQCDFSLFRESYFIRSKDAWMSARTSLIAPHLGQVLVQVAREHGAPESDIDMQALLQAYQWHRVPGTHLFPEVPAFLEMLAQTGVRRGIVTNSFAPMALRDVELSHHGILDFFPECRISAADVGRLKPHPDIFARALACLDLRPEHVVFVGDNPVADISGARQAGMKAVQRVLRHRRSYVDNAEVEPDGIIHSLDDLPLLLDDWFPGWRD